MKHSEKQPGSSINVVTPRAATLVMVYSLHFWEQSVELSFFCLEIIKHKHIITDSFTSNQSDTEILGLSEVSMGQFSRSKKHI